MGHKRKKGSASELLPDRRDQVPKFEIFFFFSRFLFVTAVKYVLEHNNNDVEIFTLIRSDLN